MNKRIHLLYGLILGLGLTSLTMYLIIKLGLNQDFTNGIKSIKQEGQFGKVITLSTIPNLIAFLIFNKFKKDFWSRGLVLATIIAAFTTIFYL